MREEAGEDAVVLVLSHVWYGSEEEVPEVKGLRGLFVQYPGREVRPVLAERCERWEAVGSGAVGEVAEKLGRLVG